MVYTKPLNIFEYLTALVYMSKSVSSGRCTAPLRGLAMLRRLLYMHFIQYQNTTKLR